MGSCGVGRVLWEYVRGFSCAETAAVMIIIVITVSLLDIHLQWLRRMMIQRGFQDIHVRISQDSP